MNRITWILIGMLVFSFVLDLIFSKSRKAKYKGKIGEKTIATQLAKLPKEYIIFNDIMIRNRSGVTQIDHVVVSNYGIFVIETKNYKGMIYGSEQTEHWQQALGSTKSNFYNPLRQNYAHVKALQGLIGLPEDAFIPIVAFSQNAKLNIKSESHVIYFNQLVSTIRGHQERLLTDDLVNVVCDKIYKGDIDSDEIFEQHNKAIQTDKAEEEAKIKAHVCPKCGGELVLRSGKYGQFLGCSNYPKCRFTDRI